MKKKVFFFLYCFLMIGGLVLFLIFSPNFIKNNDLKENKNSNSSENGMYATKIKLNCVDDITLAVGSSVELKHGFVSVEPSNKLKDVKTTITKKSGNDNGISFSNNIISALSEGKYTIIFSVLKSSSTEIYDTLIVSVVAREVDNKVQLLNNNFTNNTTVSNW